MGKDLETCLSALDSDETSEEVHVLERINMSFLVQNAILNAPNLTRFKIEGNLPVLQVNFSDTKYSESPVAQTLAPSLSLTADPNDLLPLLESSETLMRFIDVAIPKFGDDQAPSPPKPAVKHRPTSRGGFLQRPNVQEYNLEEHESEVGGDDSRDDDNDTFFEAPEISSDVSIR
jgi:vacuolar protein sorting-associated protein 13A/C